jgi:hypothetical protein
LVWEEKGQGRLEKKERLRIRIARKRNKKGKVLGN